MGQRLSISRIRDWRCARQLRSQLLPSGLFQKQHRAFKMPTSAVVTYLPTVSPPRLPSVVIMKKVGEMLLALEPMRREKWSKSSSKPR